MLKQILDGVEKAENKLDEKTFGATEIKVEVKEEIYKTFKDKYVKNS